MSEKPFPSSPLKRLSKERTKKELIMPLFKRFKKSKKDLNSLLEKNQSETFDEVDFLKGKSVNEILIEEIKKPLLTNLEKRENMNNIKYRNIKVILNCLEKLPNFVKFCILNNIDEYSVKMSAGVMKYIFVPKGNYIFTANDNVLKFYGLIRGSVCINNIKIINVEKKTNEDLFNYDRNFTLGNNINYMKKTTNNNYNNSLNNKNRELREEIYRVSDGFCFGETLLLSNNSQRSIEAVALEDSHLFYLEKEDFDLTFSKSLAKSESDKRSFIIRCITPLQDYLYHFHEFNKYITPSFLNKNDVIYVQETEADRLFLIFKGSVRIEKIVETEFLKGIQGKKDLELVNLQAKQKKSKMLMKIDKGSLFGYESLDKSKKYKYTAKADCEGTILFCIRMQHTRFKFIIEACKEYFHPIFGKIEKLLEEASELLVKHQLKMKITYRGKDVKKCGAYKLNKKEERELLHRVDQKITDLRKENLDRILQEERNKSLENLVVMRRNVKDENRDKEIESVERNPNKEYNRPTDKYSTKGNEDLDDYLSSDMQNIARPKTALKTIKTKLANFFSTGIESHNKPNIQNEYLDIKNIENLSPINIKSIKTKRPFELNHHYVQEEKIPQRIQTANHRDSQKIRLFGDSNNCTSLKNEYKTAYKKTNNIIKRTCNETQINLNEAWINRGNNNINKVAKTLVNISENCEEYQLSPTIEKIAFNKNMYTETPKKSYKNLNNDIKLNIEDNQISKNTNIFAKTDAGADNIKKIPYFDQTSMEFPIHANNLIHILKDQDLKCCSTQTEPLVETQKINTNNDFIKIDNNYYNFPNQENYDSNMDFEKQLNFSGEIQKDQAIATDLEIINAQNLPSSNYQRHCTSEEPNINTAVSSKEISYNNKNKYNKELKLNINEIQMCPELQGNIEKQNNINFIKEIDLKKDENWSKSSNQISKRNSIEVNIRDKNSPSEKKEFPRPKSKTTNHKINQVRKEARQLFIGVDLFDSSKVQNPATTKNLNVFDNINKFFLNSRTLTTKNTERFKNLFLKNKAIFKNSGKLNNFIVENYKKNINFNTNKAINNNFGSGLEILSLTAKKDGNSKRCISAFGLRKVKSKEYFDVKLEKKEKNAFVYDTGMFSIPLMQTVEK